MMRPCSLSFPLLILTFFPTTASQIPSLDFGRTTLTHYDLPLDYVASCGCVARSTHYPTAAVNALIFGSTTSFGPLCGTCFRLRLLTTPFSPLPPLGDGMSFLVNDTDAPTVVVKVTDSCPLGGQWCSQTYDPATNVSMPNGLSSMIHFDLAWPSAAIPSSFYPLDSTHTDYGVWTASYERVDCALWRGHQDAASWGSDWAQQDAACCPMLTAVLPDHFIDLNVTAQQCLCPSYDALVKSNKIDDSHLIPNTSNVLSRKEATAVNDAFRRPTTSSLLRAASVITGLLVI
jgi:hypothetical protein